MKLPVLIVRSDRKWTTEARANFEDEVQRQLIGTVLEGIKVLVLCDCEEFEIVTEYA